MKITQKQLKQIIKEETDAALSEQSFFSRLFGRGKKKPEASPSPAEPEGSSQEDIDNALEALRDRYENIKSSRSFQSGYNTITSDGGGIRYAMEKGSYNSDGMTPHDLYALIRKGSASKEDLKNITNAINHLESEVKDYEVKSKASMEKYSAKQAEKERAASSSRGGRTQYARGRFDPGRYEDGDVLDIGRLEEVIASTISELLNSKEK